MEVQFRNKPTMPARCFSIKPPGFTLIELVIVILIISLTTALIMPNLWDSGERALKAEAKRIGNTMRYVYNESLSKRQSFFIKIDLDNDTWEFESQREARRFRMNDNVTFKDIVTPSLGEISFGEVTINFGPMGTEEPVTVHLVHGETEYTVKFNHISGRAKVHEGYVL